MLSYLPSAIQQIERVLLRARKEGILSEPQHSGGYFRVTHIYPETPILLAWIWVGDDHPGQERMLLTSNFSLEKTTRLLAHPDHLTSTESRDEEAGQYGGSIRTMKSNSILAFSELPQLAGEALMLMVALYFGELSPDIVWTIAKRNNNHFFKKFYELV